MQQAFQGLEKGRAGGRGTKARAAFRELDPRRLHARTGIHRGCRSPW
ncbi:Hypothetical protein CAP_4977 [Chondromyces apiculatus DSM 436]|uniref:Uncharacterized protein n=1 Tax=Chondromyces apiculatus DSM 436 TaxID=1192034 RepID=A0A017TIA0_9BACT|nr:Hypothetical protein CAP_4977 [Chondromyces apiculatus DSM 436]